MAIKRILEAPNEILSTKTSKVKFEDPEVSEIVKDLLDTTVNQKEPEAAGLAAPQIGYNKRICVVREFQEIPNSEKYTIINHVLINPKIISHSKELDLDFESCLSIPNMYGKVLRHKSIKLIYTDENGKEIKLKAKDFFARVIQHELDHLDGKLFTERLLGELITEEEYNKLLESEND
jgi:peptide deformylase